MLDHPLSSTRGIQPTPDFYRICGLPRRVWSEADAEQVRREVNAIVRQPGGTFELHPLQAISLFELHHNYGLFAPQGVGSGKTPISLLAPFIARSSKPLLLVPAALIDKTRRDQRKFSDHFRIPNYTHFMSYELLGRPQSSLALETYKPDIIIADECHKLKSRKAAVTKRVSRYMHDHPSTRFVALSGTVTKRSLRDYWHILQWCLRERSPLPLNWSELEEWADCLDQRDGAEGRREGGALYYLCNREEYVTPAPEGVRRAFNRRLTETPGVVASKVSSVDCSIEFAVDRVELPAVVQEALAEMRHTWKTPNGEAFADALTMWRHVRELAMGFFEVWDPPAPVEWLEKRSAWMAHCRYILQNNRQKLDSPIPVINAIDRGLYPEAAPSLQAWREIKASFEPSGKPIWLSPFLIHHVAQRIRHAPPTLIWTDRRAIAEALSAATGLPFYGRGGLDRQGRSIENEPGGRSIILSVQSNKEGRNLQDRWHRNYIVSPIPSGEIWEQALGRTHRQGQQADTVYVETVVSCFEHEMCLAKALADARYMRDTMGQPQKLLLADFTNFDPDA